MCVNHCEAVSLQIDGTFHIYLIEKPWWKCERCQVYNIKQMWLIAMVSHK